VLGASTLRVLRIKAGLTQAEVGRRVGIPATVVSAYECGRRQPSLDMAGRIIDALGFETRFVRVLDEHVQARKLEQVLLLAEALPYRPRPLAKARLS
jgi:transcriptional regulator with XRE-family HTH domain